VITYFRIAAVVAFVALVGGLFYTVQSWREDSRALEAAKNDFANRAKEYNDKIADYEFQKSTSAEAQKGLANELENLRIASLALPVRIVRVCVPADPVPAAPRNAGDPEGPPTPAGELPQKAGRDIGPDLYSEADRADALVAHFRQQRAVWEAYMKKYGKPTDGN
jgi:hypothetical protein